MVSHAKLSPRRSIRLRSACVPQQAEPSKQHTAGKIKKHKSKIKSTSKTQSKSANKTCTANMPFQSPFPPYTKPSPHDCHQVHDILIKEHGESTAPNPLPPPSLTVAGCGEVPAVLDAVLRTVVSGATTMVAANKALAALVSRFGIAETGAHRGSVDWASVSNSTIEDLADTIRVGGCATGKARDILSILKMARVAELDDQDVFDEKTETRREGKRAHGSIINNDQFSLEYIRALPTPDAFHELLRFPRIGLKTAACVVLFCLQRPCFAVDTHVLRMCRWLGWIPPTANAETAFWHCEERVPSGLKYSLHRLLIRHGQNCERCKAATVPGTKTWENCVCPLEQLVVRGKKMTRG